MKLSKRLLSVVLTLTLAFTMVFAAVGVEAATKSTKKFGTVVADPAAKTVTFKATVNGKMLKSKTMHFVVNKNGGVASKSLLKTSVTSKNVADALAYVGGKAWNTKGKTLGSYKTIKKAAANGIGNKSYSHVKVTVKWGGHKYSMSSVLKDCKNLDMVYANKANDANKASGCVICNTSCWGGVAANNNRNVGDGYVARSSKLPKSGETVTVVITLK